MRELITTDDPRWQAMLDTCPHDFYQLPGYLELTAAWEGGEPRALLVEVGSCRMLLPILVRPLPAASLPAGGFGADRDATSPYGYPGPIWNPGAEQGDVAAALRACIELGGEIGLVTSFIRLHPVLDDGNAAELLVDSRVRLVDHGPTVGIDLTLDDEATDRATSRSIRADVRRMQAKGFVVRMDEPGDFEAFQAIYLATMERLGSGDFYRFGPAYFDGFRRHLRDHFHLFAVVAPNGEVACAGIVTSVGRILQGHLNGTAQAYLPDSPIKYMIVAARDWGRRTGANVFHMGGGLGTREDKLYEFKCGFGELRYRYKTLQIVHRPDAYRALAPEDADKVVGFFPPYRARKTAVA